MLLLEGKPDVQLFGPIRSGFVRLESTRLRSRAAWLRDALANYAALANHAAHPYLVRYQKAVRVLSLVLGVFPLYFVINARTRGEVAADLTLAIDRAVAFEPTWQYVYSAVYLFMLLPLFVVRCNELIRRAFWAYLFILVVSFGFFLAYPVRYPRPELDVSSLATWGARLNFFLDGPHNCFPSLHLGTAFASALVLWRVDRPVGLGAMLAATVIGYSTMAVKQHFFLDVLAGTSLGVAAYALFVRSYPRGGRPRAEILRPRRYLLLAAACYGAFVLFCLCGYLADWRPWEPG
ncbi:MAG: phosphatase PAP2 family protein [Candidatus Schekmanbacteria bacterium]|nr:phosphatase PAP2 family protein [Candidatus Schekmanbacteria bacterium]